MYNMAADYNKTRADALASKEEYIEKLAALVQMPTSPENMAQRIITMRAISQMDTWLVFFALNRNDKPTF